MGIPRERGSARNPERLPRESQRAPRAPFCLPFDSVLSMCARGRDHDNDDDDDAADDDDDDADDDDDDDDYDVGGGGAADDDADDDDDDDDGNDADVRW